MVKVGDRIGYSAHFLHSVAADYVTASRRGTVKAFEQRGQTLVALVLWDDLHSLQRVLPSNIARVGSVAFSDPHARVS